MAGIWCLKSAWQTPLVQVAGDEVGQQVEKCSTCVTTHYRDLAPVSLCCLPPRQPWCSWRFRPLWPFAKAFARRRAQDDLQRFTQSCPNSRMRRGDHGRNLIMVTWFKFIFLNTYIFFKYILYIYNLRMDSPYEWHSIVTTPQQWIFPGDRLEWHRQRRQLYDWSFAAMLVSQRLY